MQRAALTLVLLGAIASAGLLAYSIDADDSMLTATDHEVAAPNAQPIETTAIEQPMESGEASMSPTDSPDLVARRIQEATGDDASKRALAIEALSTAPKSLAIPVLQKILSAGADGDRQLALNSLRTLAVEQGDADGIIRDTLRLTVYDGDDYVVADTQAVLEDIERSLDEIASNRNQ